MSVLVLSGGKGERYFELRHIPLRDDPARCIQHFTERLPCRTTDTLTSLCRPRHCAQR